MGQPRTRLAYRVPLWMFMTETVAGSRMPQPVVRWMNISMP
jgi:hypothetical protein